MRPSDVGFWYGVLLAFTLEVLVALLVVAFLLVVVGL